MSEVEENHGFQSRCQLFTKQGESKDVLHTLQHRNTLRQHGDFQLETESAPPWPLRARPVTAARTR